MSSPLRIELRPEPVMRGLLVLLAALAVAALLLSAAPPWLVAAPPALLALAWPRAPRRGERELVLRDDGSAVLLAPDGTETEAEPRRLQRRGWLTVLTLEVQGRMLVHSFTPATLDAAASRRLSLWFERRLPQERDRTGVPVV
jgi:hypothetical protein